jgi:hypothetical protein
MANLNVEEAEKVVCWRCEDPPTREFCYPAEPWVPYCPKHPPQYGTAGDRPFLVNPPEGLFRDWVDRKVK